MATSARRIFFTNMMPMRKRFGLGLAIYFLIVTIRGIGSGIKTHWSHNCIDKKISKKPIRLANISFEQNNCFQDYPENTVETLSKRWILKLQTISIAQTSTLKRVRKK